MEPDSIPSDTSVKRRCVMVCQHRSCLRNGSEAVLEEFRAIAPKGVFVSPSACLGQCASGPTVQIVPDMTWYCRVKPEHIPIIVEQHLVKDQPVEVLLHPRLHLNAAAFQPLE